MSPTLDALARQLSAVVASRSIEGLAWTTPDGSKTGRINSNLPTFMQPPAAAIMDLSDPVTAAALLPLAREVSECPRMVVGTVNERWMVFQSLEHYFRWREGYGQAPPPLTGVDDGGYVLDYDTEVEALVAVILRGGE